MLKKKTVICLLLICAMVISWVQPAAATDGSYGDGFDLLIYSNENAISYWKNFDLYAYAQKNQGRLGDYLLLTCSDSASYSGTKYYGALAFCQNTYYEKTVLRFACGLGNIKPYTSADLVVGSCIDLANYTASNISNAYPGYSSSYTDVPSWFFLNYADALEVYNNYNLSYSLYFLCEDTRVYPPTGMNASGYMVSFEKLGRISKEGIVTYYSFKNPGSQTAYRVEGSSHSLYWFVPLAYHLLDGVWQAKDTISGSSSVSQELNFSVKFSGGDVNYTGIDFRTSGSTNAVSYSLASGSETVYVNGWLGDTRKTIDLGSEPQNVSSEFYSWFTSNFTRTGDSEIYDDEISKVKIYDYGSGSLIHSLSLPIPHIIYATTTGIQIEEYGTAETLYSYTWSGSDAFAGFSLLSRDYVDYEVGTNFVNMSDSVTLYLYGEDDLSGGDDNPGGSGSTDNTDPTEPGDSPSTEPTVDPLDKEKDEINGSGNSALDDLTQAVPDYSQDFIAALGDLVRAFGYEGTNCELVIPALVLPGVDGLIPETELLPVTTVDFAEAFLIFPEKVVIVVRSLLTAALIVYCFKELYDTISYFLTLKRGDSNG